VPGTLAGLLRVHEQLGSLAIGDVLRPAIEIASRGVTLNPRQAEFLALLTPIMTATPRSRALYAPEGALLGVGERFVNLPLARFLESIPTEGARGFYEGPTARSIVESVRGDGVLTLDDLKSYRVIERGTHGTHFCGHEVRSCPAPMIGGALVTQCLDGYASSTPDHPWGSPRHLDLLVRAMQAADRARHEDRLFSPGSALGGTTHISVADRLGNVATMTCSNGEGSGVMAGETGIMLNNMQGEEDLHPDGFHALPPGTRVASMMAPCLVTRDDQVVLALGSGGSNRIRSALFQVIVNVLDLGMSLEDAVNAPRLHFDGHCVQVEPGYDPGAIEHLRKTWIVNEWPDRSVYFGGVHAVVPGREAMADPRRDGRARVVH
jgi:gamma-glutamyltranspeptidase/glutathione hydrolase